MKKPGVLQDDKITSKNSMKNISYIFIHKFQHELGKSDLLPGSPCCCQSCKGRAEQEDSFPLRLFTLDPLAF